MSDRDRAYEQWRKDSDLPKTDLAEYAFNAGWEAGALDRIGKERLLLALLERRMSTAQPKGKSR